MIPKPPVKGINANISFIQPFTDILINIATDPSIDFTFQYDGIIMKKEGLAPFILKCDTTKNFLGIKKYNCYIKADNIKQEISYELYCSLYNTIGFKKSFIRNKDANTSN